MKKTFLLVLISCVYLHANAQIVATSMNEEFKQLAGLGSHQSGFEGIQTYSSNNVKGSQFFYSGWEPGTVTTSNNTTVNDNNYLYLFDKVRQLLFITPKTNAGKDVLLADPDKLQSFTIVTDKPHYFTKATVFDPAMKNEFFEVLVNNSNYSLLKLTRTSFEKANTEDMLKVKNGEFSDEFVDHSTYYIFHQGKLQKINFQQYSIRKALKDDQAKTDTYFNLHQNDVIDENFLIGIINNINS